MSKQDRQGARTLAELMSRYNFGKSFAEVMGLAESAEKAAKEAGEAASKLDKKLTSEEIFNRLTENGQLQGLYRGDDGELYVNASYIKSGEILADLIKTGIITSTDGTVKIDLNNNCVTVDGLHNGYKTQVILSASGMTIYGENREGVMEETIEFTGGVGGLPASITNPSWRENTGLVIASGSGALSLGTTEAATKIDGSSISIDNALKDVRILGKQVYWKYNGDGTFALCGE